MKMIYRKLPNKASPSVICHPRGRCQLVTWNHFVDETDGVAALLMVERASVTGEHASLATERMQAHLAEQVSQQQPLIVPIIIKSRYQRPQEVV